VSRTDALIFGGPLAIQSKCLERLSMSDRRDEYVAALSMRMAEDVAALSMRMERETISLSKGEYRKKAKQLSESDKKNLRLVIGRQYSDELNKIELQELEKLALFLEREDERINEWRKVIEKTRAGELPEKYLPAKRPID